MGNFMGMGVSVVLLKQKNTLLPGTAHEAGYVFMLVRRYVKAREIPESENVAALTFPITSHYWRSNQRFQDNKTKKALATASKYDK